MTMKSLPLLLVIISVLLAGCGATPTYSLKPDIKISPEQDSVAVTGSVYLTGKYGDDFRIRGVQLEVWQNETKMRTLSLGTFHEDRQEVKVSFVEPNRPNEFRLRYRTISQPGIDGEVTNLKWVPDEQVYEEVEAENPRLTQKSAD